MTLAAGLQLPTAAEVPSCGFVYLRSNLGHSSCDGGTGYQHRASGSCSWIGPGDPAGISEYAVVGPWADPDSMSSLSCPKYYVLFADVETRLENP